MINRLLKETRPPFINPYHSDKRDPIRVERIDEALQVCVHEQEDKERRGVDEASRAGKQTEQEVDQRYKETKKWRRVEYALQR